MANIKYSKELCKTLFNAANDPQLKTGHRRTRYEAGEELTVGIRGVHPAVEGSATMVIDRFLGGGFAGQVYRVRLTALDLPEGAGIEGLETGRLYAVKIIVPPSAFSKRFRNAIYWLAFQGPFSAQVNYGACRSGLILQKLVRRAAKLRFGRESAVKDAYASFWDESLHAYGEITEWVEGRMWLLEADDELTGRKNWRTVPLHETNSPEYIAKRRFMAELVELMHDMGAPEFARQYEWWTMKSQPNAMKRTDLPDAAGPADGLCAIDFRAGLALLPFLPMSPADIKLIWNGLFKRRTPVQFDRCDIDQMKRFFEAHSDLFADLQPAVEAFFEQDRAYRRSLPDVTHHGWRLLTESTLRQDVRRGLIEGYRADELADAEFAGKLAGGGLRFTVFYLIGAIPLLGKMIRKRWGNRAYREHLAGILTRADYRRAALRAHAAAGLTGWHRAGRTDEAHAGFLLDHPAVFLLERFTLGLLPVVLHRVALRPSRILIRLQAGWLFLKNFMVSPGFREQWFLNEIRAGEKEGMLTAAERAHLESVVRDPFIVRYLKCLGVHFATVPVTQLFSVIIGAVWAGWLLANGHSGAEALGAFGLTVAVFQITPISPGSLCRGGFVVYLMIRERNVRDYLIAAPVSFLKYVGYLAFPLQMTTTYPQLARFMASRWATNMVHVVPVFGEKGALLEHWVFDTFFNRPQKMAKWAAPRMNWLLSGWMIVGLIFCGTVLAIWTPDLHSRAGFNLLLGTVVLFILPRLLFYPLMMRKAHRPAKDARF
jgi:hypothetical protein